MILVSRKVTFDAAHWLPYHKGKCRNLHGHTWTVEVGVAQREGNPLLNGMVVDFKDLEELMEKAFLSTFDHSCLNDHLTCPTAEVIAEHILDTLCDMLSEHPATYYIKYVRVWESPDSMAEVS